MQLHDFQLKKINTNHSTDVRYRRFTCILYIHVIDEKSLGFFFLDEETGNARSGRSKTIGEKNSDSWSSYRAMNCIRLPIVVALKIHSRDIFSS